MWDYKVFWSICQIYSSLSWHYSTYLSGAHNCFGILVYWEVQYSTDCDPIRPNITWHFDVNNEQSFYSAHDNVFVFCYCACGPLITPNRKVILPIFCSWSIMRLQLSCSQTGKLAGDKTHLDSSTVSCVVLLPSHVVSPLSLLPCTSLQWDPTSAAAPFSKPPIVLQ